MQEIKSKTMAIVIALFMLSSMTLIAMPNASAQSTRVTYAFIGATPNPVGIGQQTLIHVGITHQLASVQYGWIGLTVTVTKPDNTSETLTAAKTDSTGGTGIVYTPTMVGTYYLQTNFPEQLMPVTSAGTPANTTMLASKSEKMALIVTQESRVFYPGAPLPTEYWTRPIDQQFREWYPVSKSFLGAIPLDGIYSEGHEGPESGHILWAKPLTIGGLVGGDFGLLGSGGLSVGFETGDAYQGKFSSPGIIAGILIYTHHTAIRPLEYTAVNLRTGEELWTKTFLDNRTISQAQLFYWESYNYQGTFAYLWVTVGTTWYGFDLYTAELRLTINNVPSGTNIIGKRGEIFRYTVNQNAGWMALWNLSALISMAGSWASPGPSTYNASATGSDGQPTAAAARAWSWNITIPKGLPGSVRAVALDNKVVGSVVNTTDVGIWAFSLKKGQEGQLLFNKDWKAPADWVAGNQTIGWSTASIAEEVGVVWSKEARVRWGFSLETGDFLWGPTEPEAYLAIYETWSVIAYGKLYTHGMKGTVDCYDIQTGKHLWTFASTDKYTEILWSNTWPIRIDFITDGKIYCRQSEHSSNQPLPRGAPYICLNATTGEEIWRVNLRGTDWGGHAIIGDSIIAMMNTYDQRVYAVGKGPSALTVTAPDVSVELGKSLVIKGTVTDISPGTEEYALRARFPNGVPAMSDTSMSEWMQYVYLQFPQPTNVTGVRISIDVLDSNGNYRNIGTTTSDGSGMFSCQWTPDITGKYTVVATFAGSESYWPSHAETSFAVDPATVINATEQPVQAQPPFEMYFAASTIAIIVAIVIVGLLLFRKKP